MSTFQLAAPAASAVSIALLDTGITSRHPLLAGAVLAAHTVVPQDSSGEDGDGHGTRLAGVALHEDVGAIVEANGGAALHWLESVKLLTRSEHGTADEKNARIWPVLTLQAIEAAESSGQRNRVFALAVTAELHDPTASTTWSQAVDQFAFNENRGRVICVSIGNCDPFEDPELARQYPRLHLQRKLEQPAQAVNALTIGAYTARATPAPESGAPRPLAPIGGISPNTRSGPEGSPVKPDVVFEGGNVGFDGERGYHGEATLSTLTTGRDVFQKPLVLFEGTSAATGHAARFVANVWAARLESRPETIRGLVVHSARWTEAMLGQFRGLDERLALCGYGVPDLSRATECIRSRATIVIEDTMPNSVVVEDDEAETRRQRVVKYVRLPFPSDVLLQDAEQEVELAVTLSFFGEPSTFKRREHLGLRLRWDIQSGTETEEQFQQRINRHVRDEAAGNGTYERTQGFEGWAIGPERRGRGSVQSDRLVVPASYLAGPKLIAVSPVLGWWDRRNDTLEEGMAFSLIVSLEAPGVDVYTPIALALEAAPLIEVEIQPH